MARTQSAEFHGGAAYYASGGDHLVHPRYATAIRVEGTTGENVIMPHPRSVKGAERFWIINEGMDTCAVVDHEATSVADVDAGDACVIWPDGSGGWVVGSTYTVRYP